MSKLLSPLHRHNNDPSPSTYCLWMIVLVCLTLKNIFAQERLDSLALFGLETTEQTAPAIIVNSNSTAPI
jgi:hypothetical protein